MFIEKTINYKKCGIYIIEFDNGIKIGKSNNINSRIHSQYKKPWCREIKRIKVYACRNFNAIELSVKKYFKDYIKNNSTEYITGVDFDTVCAYAYKTRKVKKRKIENRVKTFDPKVDNFILIEEPIKETKTMDQIFESLYSKYD